MTDYIKHVGRIRNTEQRCVVVFMQIPGLEDHALVINTESLPPRYEQHLMEILESPEGQTAQDLGPVMARRLMPDTGRDVLYEFHQQGYLRREPVENVVMLPRPNMPFVLKDILLKMGKVIPMRSPKPMANSQLAEIYETYTPPVQQPISEQTVENPYLSEPQTASTTQEKYHKFNPYGDTQGARSAEQTLGIARNIIIEAELLEGEAQRKRDQAYNLAPELRPSLKQTPTPQAESAPRKASAPRKRKPSRPSRKPAPATVTASS